MSLCTAEFPFATRGKSKGQPPITPPALAIALFGHNQWNIHLLDLLLTAAGMAALWRICGRLADRFAANLAVIFYLLWYWGLGYWHAAQPDASLGVFQLLALNLLLGNEKTIARWRMALAGGCLAIATLYKPPFAACLLGMAPAAWIGERKFQARIVSLLAGIAGFALPLALMVIWFAYRRALHDLWEIQFIFNVQVHRSTNVPSFMEFVHAVLWFFQEKGAIFLISCVCVGLAYLLQNRRRDFWIVLIVLCVDFACVLMQQKFFPYHWIAMYGPLALLAGLAGFRVKSGA